MSDEFHWVKTYDGAVCCNISDRRIRGKIIDQEDSNIYESFECFPGREIPLGKFVGESYAKDMVIKQLNTVKKVMWL